MDIQIQEYINLVEESETKYLKEIHDLKTQIEILVEESKMLKTQMTQKMVDKEDHHQILKTAGIHYMKKIEQISTELNTSQQERDRSNKKTNLLRQENKQLTEKLVLIQKENQELSKKIVLLQNDTEGWQLLKNSLLEKIDTLGKDSAAFKLEHESLSEQLKTTREELEKYKNNMVVANTILKLNSQMSKTLFKTGSTANSDTCPQGEDESLGFFLTPDNSFAESELLQSFAEFSFTSSNMGSPKKSKSVPLQASLPFPLRDQEKNPTKSSTVSKHNLPPTTPTPTPTPPTPTPLTPTPPTPTRTSHTPTTSNTHTIEQQEQTETSDKTHIVPLQPLIHIDSHPSNVSVHE